MADYSRLSLFTRNHAQHDPEWTLQGSRTVSLICIPCVVEMIEDPEVLVVRKTFVVGEMLRMISGDNRELLDMLADNQRLALHIVETVHELLEIHKEDKALTEVTIELLVQLCCLLESDDLVCCLLHQLSLQVEKSHNLLHSLPSLHLLGKLLNSIPALADLLLQTEVPLMNTLIACLGASEEQTKTGAVYALLKVLTTSQEQMPLHLYGQIANQILALLTGAQSLDLQQNTMGLLRKLFESEEVTRGLMQQNRSSLPSALKKMLMSRDNSLQVSTMQCVRQLLVQDRQDPSVTHYADDLLNADVAEFLFEALATTDGALLSCTFGCLLFFTDCQSFFTNCHTVYGVESIVRAVHHCIKLNNTEALHQGLQVLSEILRRQPEDVHLLNGLGIHKQINSLLQACLKHTDSGIQMQAGNVLKHFLRKDHLPKPVDYISLIDLLQCIQDCMERLPRPLSRSSSRRHRRQQRKHNVDDTTLEECDTAWSKEERILLGGLQVIHQALSLADTLLHDPLPESSLVVMGQNGNSDDQTSRKNSLEGLQYFLMQVLDATCIPIFMMNHEELSNHAVFVSFFQMLCMSFKFNIDLKDFAFKLAGSSFIQLSIKVKNKIISLDSKPELSDVVNLFLVELCTSLVDSSQTESKEMRHLLEKGLPLIKGNCEDMLGVLCNQTEAIKTYRMLAPDTSDSIDIKQQAILALLYVAFLHSDRLVSEIDLEDALDVFVSTLQDFKSLCSLSIKHLFFLSAVCYCANNGSGSLSKNGHRFHLYLSEQDITTLYSHHPVMLQWCYTSNTLPDNLAKSMLEMWISNLEDQMDADVTIVSENVKTTLELLQTNTKAVAMLLDVLCSSKDDITEKAAWLVKTTLNQSSTTESNTIVEVLNDRLPSVMQRLFLRDEHDTQDIHSVALLDLLCCVHQRCHLPDLDPTSVKLTYHVTNLLSKESTGNIELVRVALNYLTCLMVQTADLNDSRVAMVILSSSGVLKMLEQFLQMAGKQLIHQPKLITLQGCALSLLAQLVNMQRKATIKVQYTVNIDLATAIHMVQKAKSTVIRVCGTQLWSALLEAKFLSPVVRLVDNRDREQLLEDADVGLEIGSVHLRRLLIVLQNNILKGDGMLSQLSVHCFQTLIAYTSQNNKDLGNHLLNQPWNQLLLSRCLDLRANEGMLDGVLRLLNVFLQYGTSYRTIVNQALVDAVLEGIVKHKRKDTLKSSTISQYFQFLTQIIEQPNLRISCRLRERIASQMKNYIENPHSMQEHPSILMCGQGIIVSSLSSALMTPQDLKSKASKICGHITQLTSTSN